MSLPGGQKILDIEPGTDDSPSGQLLHDFQDPPRKVFPKIPSTGRHKSLPGIYEMEFFVPL